MSVINTNVKSLIAQDSLRANNNKLSTAMERLSTGSKINSAKDDAAGLAIGTRMTAQVRGLTMAIKNANDGINLAQTAEGAMTEVTDMLQRMRELAVQAGNSTNTDADRAAMNDEVTQLKAEIDRVAGTTQFNNMNILDGSFNGKLQIGNNANQKMDLAIGSVATTAMGETKDGLAIGATTAKLVVSGASQNVAAYQGASFNVSVNGVNKTITLPPAQDVTTNVSGAAASRSFNTVDASLANQTSGQVGGIYERTLDFTTAANAAIKIQLNNAPAETIDISNADYYADVTKATGEEIVAAMQAELDANAAFQGANRLSVSLDNGHISIAMANGAAATLTLSDTAGGTAADKLIAKLTNANAAVTTTYGSIDIGVKTASFTGNTSFDIGNNHFDLTAKINQHGWDVAKLTAEQFVTVYNETAKVNGVQVSQASVDGDGKLSFSMADPTAPAIGSPFQNSSLLDVVTLSNSADAAVFADSASFGRFGEYATTVTASTNDVLTLSVNDGTTANIQLSAGTYKTMTDLAAQVQAKVDASGAFTGNNALTITAVQDDDNRWGLKVTNANGYDVALGGTFLTKTDSSKNTGLGVTPAAGLPTQVITSGVAGTTTESSAVTFKALAVGESITVGGLTYTAKTARTDANVATAFASLAAGAAGTSDADGTFSGTLNGFSTGAAAAAVVTFTSATAQTNVTDLLISGGKSLENSTTVIGSVTNAGVDHLVTVHGPDFPPSAGATAFTERTLDLSTAAKRTFNVSLYGGANVAIDLTQAITDRDYDNTKLTGQQLVNVLNDTFAANGAFAGNNAITASLTNDGQMKLQLAVIDPSATTPALALNQTGGKLFVTTAFGATVAGTANSNNLGELVLSNAGDSERFGITDMTIVAGTNSALVVEVGAGNPINLTLDAGRYTDAYALADNVRSQIANSGAFAGGNALTVTVVSDANGSQGLHFQSATGESVKISGNFVTHSTGLKEAAAVTFPPVANSVGGIDLSGGDDVTLAVADSSGNLVSRSFNLGSTGSHVSFGNYASALQSAANTAFAGSGITFTASVSNGSFTFKADQANISSTDLSGSGISAAFGSDMQGAAQTQTVAASRFTSMSDVAAAINEDLAGAATAAFDAGTQTWSFTAAGQGGNNSTISLSGAGLSSVSMAGNLSATGEAGNATASKLADINVLTTASATASLASIDNSIEYVSKQRSLLGAIQNRLEHTVNNLTNIVTNTEASRSAIMDADYSKETTALAKSQILTQAATAMLAQANQSAQGVLSLLK